MLMQTSPLISVSLMRTVMSYELSDRLPRIPSVIGIQGIPGNLSLKKKKHGGKALWILCLVRKKLISANKTYN